MKIKGINKLRNMGIVLFSSTILVVSLDNNKVNAVETVQSPQSRMMNFVTDDTPLDLDPTLETFVISNLNDAGIFRSKEPYTYGDLKKLEIFSVYSKGIPPKLQRSLTTISGLEYATNLKEIVITSEPELKDITPLEKLTKITKLNLTSTSVTSYETLQKLQSLETLVLGGDYVKDLMPLKKLPNLKILKHSSYPNFSPLDSVKISDLSAFNDLSGLDGVAINYDDVEDLNPLKNNRNLSWFNLNNNLIKDLSPLGGNDKLFMISLDNNYVEDLSTLNKMPNLTTAYLSNNKIQSLDVLKDNKQLRTVYASNNQISDLSKLRNFFDSMKKYQVPSPDGTITNTGRVLLSNQSINRTIKVKKGTNIKDLNPCLDLNGEVMPMTALTKDGTTYSNEEIQESGSYAFKTRFDETNSEGFH